MIFTLDDLKNKDFGGVNFCVVGDPIAHSLSPLMQNAAIEFLAKSDPEFARWKYLKFLLKPEEIAEALPLFKRGNFRGINFTVPHKLVAASLADTVDPDAKLMGACNTFSLLENGMWRGSNTDGFGLEKALEENFGIKLKNADISIIGAGGAARAAAFYSLLNGAKSLRIFNRSAERMNLLESDLRANSLECKTHIFGGEFPPDMPENSVIINAAAVGIKPEDKAIADFSTAPKGSVFFDMPYRPNSETASVLEARKCGIPAVSGLSMLAWQGAKSLSIWSKANVDELGKIMTLALQKNQ